MQAIAAILSGCHESVTGLLCTVTVNLTTTAVAMIFSMCGEHVQSMQLQRPAHMGTGILAAHYNFDRTRHQDVGRSTEPQVKVVRNWVSRGLELLKRVNFRCS